MPEQWGGAEPTLAEVQAEFPGWECFRDTSGLYYAQTTYRAGGALVRGDDPLDLRDQIIRWKRLHGDGAS